MRDCSVLVADDAAAIRLLLTAMLEREPGISVVGAASNGREAVGLCELHKPDVVVLDIAMPVMDGLQAIPMIRQVSPLTSIVVLSGFTTSEIKRRARELGADTFVEKGAVSSEIARAVRDRCSRGARQD